MTKYNEAILSDKIGWSKAVEEEYDRKEINKVWIPTKLKDVPRGVKVRTLTWDMKKKSNYKLRTRLNDRGYEQFDGIRYESSDIHVPVTNDITVRIIMALAIDDRMVRIDCKCSRCLSKG